MGGWGEPHGHDPETALLRAIKAFLDHGSTGNIERLRAAYEAYERRPRIYTSASAPQPLVVYVPPFHDTCC